GTDVRQVDDHAHRLAHFTRLAVDITALGIAQVGLGDGVVLEQAQIGLVPERHATAGTDPVVDVERRRVGFGCAPTLEDVEFAEALHPAGPYIPAQAGAEHAAQAVVAVVGAGRLVQQVATDFPDVLEDGDPVLAHIRPELAGAELATE